MDLKTGRKIVQRQFARAQSVATFMLMVMVVLSTFGANSSLAQVLPPDKGENDDSKNWESWGDSNGPLLEFETLQINLGEITDHESVEVVFRFTNVGNSLLNIEKVTTSCGCTVAELRSRDYLPNESGEIEVTFDPTGRTGINTKSISLVSNDREFKSRAVKLIADIKPIIESVPKRLNIDQIVYGAKQEATIKFQCDWKVFEVQSLKVIGEMVDLEMGTHEKTLLEDGTTHHEVTAKLTIDGHAPLGWLRRNIEIVALVGDGINEPFEHKATANLAARIVGDVEAQPVRLQIGVLNTGDTYEKEVRILSRTGRDFNILGVEPLNPPNGEMEITVSSETMPDGSPIYILKVTGTAPDKPGIVSGILLVKTDIEDQPPLKVHYVGSVRKSRSRR